MSPSSLSQIEPRLHVPPVVAGMVMFATVLVVMLLFVLLRPAPQPIIDDCSLHRECRSASDFLERLVDVAAPPCQDFYGYVCNRWIADSDLSGMNLVQNSVREFFQSLHESLILRSNINVSENRDILAAFYKLCYDLVNSSQSSLKSILYPLRKYSDIIQLSNYTLVLQRLIELSLSHGIDIIFGLSLVRSAESVRLCLFQGKSLSEKLNVGTTTAELSYYVERLTREVGVVLLKATNTNISTLLEVDLKLASYTATKSVFMYHATSLGILTKYLTAQDWLDSINEFLPKQTMLDVKSDIMSNDIDAMRNIIRFFEDVTGPKLVYIYVHILVELTRFDFERERVISRSNRTTNFCLGISRTAFPFTWAKYFASFLPSTSTRESASLAFELLKSASNRETLKWMDDSDSYVAFEKLKRISIFTMSLQSSDSTLNDTAYETVNFSSGFSNVYLSLKTIDKRLLLEQPPQEHEAQRMQLLLEDEVIYSKQLDSILVPVAVNTEHVTYPGKVPIYYNMGTLGTLLGRELSRLILSDVAGSEAWTTSTRVKFNEFVDCIETFAQVSLNVSLNKSSDVSQELFLWTRGASLAFRGMKRGLQEHSGAKEWHNYWKKAQKTFFIRFCLLSCNSDATPRPLTPRAQCLVPLANMWEFAEAFECEGAVQGQFRKLCASL